MDKQTFLGEIAHKLKMLGYKKNKHYWYRENKGYLLCVNLQGSQWNKDDYYVEFGVAFLDSNVKYPTILQWFCRHRCMGKNGSKNITPEELLSFLEYVQENYPNCAEVTDYLIKMSSAKVSNQYWI